MSEALDIHSVKILSAEHKRAPFPWIPNAPSLENTQLTKTYVYSFQ